MRADFGVAVFEQVGGCEVDKKGAESQDAECPGEAEVCDHALRSEGVNQAAEAGSGGCNGVGDAAAGCEPLGYDAYGTDEEELWCC